MTNDEHDNGNPAGGWQAAGPSAGWYQDPWDAQRRRYWDGQGWTGDVSFEPPGAWNPPTERELPVAPPPPAPPAPWVPQAQPLSPWQTTGAPPAAAGWGGGWGQPPQVPGAWGGPPMWQAPAPAPAGTSRVHVGIVALIAAVAVLAGVGIGSQINTTSSSAAIGGATTVPGSGGNGSGGNGSGGTASGGFTSPFGGGTSGGTSGSSNLSAAQQAVAKRVDQSVVDVNTQLSYQSGAAAGTGVVLTSNGTILTNNHVVDGATAIKVTVVSTGRTYTADVVGTDVTEDVAVLQLQGASGLTPITLGSSSAVRSGDQVLAVGNAGGAGGVPSAVTGTVRALNQTITASDANGTNAEILNGLIQTDAPIQAGDSGGPLVDSRGALIGMNTAASSANQVNGAASVGFAIPVSSAITIANQMQQGRPSSKIHIGQTGFLGVSVKATGSSTAPGAAAPPVTAGAAVDQVVTGSPAEKAGIAAGSVITGVDGTTVDSATALTTSLRVHHPGDQVSITWSDAAGSAHTAIVTLGVGPAA